MGTWNRLDDSLYVEVDLGMYKILNVISSIYRVCMKHCVCSDSKVLDFGEELLNGHN